jgi:hypothetical protein
MLNVLYGAWWIFNSRGEAPVVARQKMCFLPSKTWALAPGYQKKIGAGEKNLLAQMPQYSGGLGRFQRV